MNTRETHDKTLSNLCVIMYKTKVSNYKNRRVFQQNIIIMALDQIVSKKGVGVWRVRHLSVP